MPSVIKGLSRQLWIYNRARDFSLSLSTINIGVSTWTWFFFFFFPSTFYSHTYRHVFFPPSLSPLLQRGRSKATLCSFRKAACSTTFTIRRNAGNLTGKQTGREDEATWEYRFTCSPHRNSILVGAWFTGVPGSMSCVRKVSVISDRMNFLRFFSIFLSSSFFLNLFATT